MAHVKWLSRIDVIAEPFTGFQQAVAYRVRRDADETGDPVTRIAPRALVIPPGFPDFMSRARIVRSGAVLLEGRAWSGRSPVTEVEVSVDNGQSWLPATLDPPAGHRWAWRRWQVSWTATPGSYVLTARATDAQGGIQPTEQVWNRGGFANNAAQQVPVTCLA
jgi:hypothetical protein